VKYILDTDISIYFLRQEQKVVERVLNTPPKDLALTIINKTELFFGAFNSTKKKKNLEAVENFTNKIHIFPFCEQSSYIFAKEKADLTKKGNIIADLDLMIASIVLANNGILITNNLKHFERIHRLKIENWYMN
jgi:tRNA(fMet)-specific endonuclease VapC